jgi:hypothetical protein
MLESDDIRRLPCSRVAIGFGRAPHEITIPATGDDKSSVDDFAIGRGIVSTRVGLPYDLLRLSPRPSICIRKLTQTQTRFRSRSDPPNHKHTHSIISYHTNPTTHTTTQPPFSSRSNKTHYTHTTSHSSPTSLSANTLQPLPANTTNSQRTCACVRARSCVPIFCSAKQAFIHISRILRPW